MKGLTEKQQRVWDLFNEGKSPTETARLVGVTQPVVTKVLTVCRRKLGITTEQSRAAKTRREELDTADPVEFAGRLDAATEPDKLGPVKEALAAAGISSKAAEAYVARLKRRYPGVLQAGKALKNAELIDMIGGKIHMVLQAMDEHVIQEASFRDLALGGTALIEKYQLLKGQPTAITSDLERKKLVELTPLLLAEAKRRGLTIEGTATVVNEPLRLPA